VGRVIYIHIEGPARHPGSGVRPACRAVQRPDNSRAGHGRFTRPQLRVQMQTKTLASEGLN
jgi:hypothetical protein